jgi:predicted Zn finger-like uncharacterized protein
MLKSKSGINEFGQEGALRSEFQSMATILICPRCGTRYETPAVIPPEGRKVRCSRCTHVWIETRARQQAVADGGRPQPVPAGPAGAPQAPNLAALQAAAGMAPSPAEDVVFGAPEPPPPPATQNGHMADASFGEEEDVAEFASPDAQAAQYDEAAQFEPQSYTSYEPSPPALQPPPPKARRKSRSGVAIGWGALAATLLMLAGFFFLAPRAVVSMAPGAAKLYAALGMPVNLRGLNFESVRYSWDTEAGQQVLDIDGDIINVTSRTLEVPTVVFVLMSENMEEIDRWATRVREEPLEAGERSAFAARIPNPPAEVRSLRVHFDSGL